VVGEVLTGVETVNKGGNADSATPVTVWSVSRPIGHEMDVVTVWATLIDIGVVNTSADVSNGERKAGLEIKEDVVRMQDQSVWQFVRASVAVIFGGPDVFPLSIDNV